MPGTSHVPEKKMTHATRSVSPFQSLQDEIERLFHAFSLPELHWPDPLEGKTGALGLRSDVSESDTEIQITSELPGVSEDDIDITLENGLLRISAVKNTEDQKDEKTWHVSERSYGRFERSMRMPAGIDPATIKADYKDGVLKIRVPKPTNLSSSSQKIPVKKS